MPLVAFSALPDDARLWVFGSEAQLSAESESTLLAAVDEYLDGWRAHGSPLTVARDWRDARFLAIAVDQRDEAASGCSLDALFRILHGLEKELGSSLLGNARVYYRAAGGAIRVTDRVGFAELSQQGTVDAATRVFDLSVQTVGDWQQRFELPAASAWHGGLLMSTV
ncbi:MAG: hypothetical protein ABI026_00445 [Gemmatimonadaceae bacterium]